MIISQDIQQKIIDEFNNWLEHQYAGKDKTERQKLGQFFTPPQLTIKMLEKFESIKNKTILDPTCGAGGLLAAAIIAGANPKLVYGIEIDEAVLDIAKKRLCSMGVPEKNLKIGNALESDAYEFDSKPIEHDQLAMTVIIENRVANIEIISFPNNVLKSFSIDITDKQFAKLLRDAKQKGLWLIAPQLVNTSLKYDKMLDINKNNLAKLAKKNKFNSFDDFQILYNK